MTARQIATPFGRLWHGVGHALQAWTTRNELAQLDDRMLKDLGISRAQAQFEASRGPFRGGSGRGL